MHPLEALLRSAEPSEEKISHVGQIARLRDFAERLKEPCPFKAGDLVTPRKGSNLKGVGDPHLVIELCEPFDRAGRDPTGHAFAAVYDMKVACLMSGHECLYYHWSGDYERYVGDGV